MVWWEYMLRVLPPLTGQLVAMAPLETMRKIRDAGAVGNLPLVPYFSMCLSGILWFTYGRLVGEPTIWASNLLPFALGCLYCGIFIQNAPPSFALRPYAIAAASVVAVVVAALVLMPPESAATLLGLVGNTLVVAMFGGPLAAMRTVIRDRSTESLPFGMCVATFVNCLLWFLYGTLVIGDANVWVGNGIGLASSIVQLALFATYGMPPSARSGSSQLGADSATDDAPSVYTKSHRGDDEEAKLLQ
jgi:solute carrier family 50 protein (sugar transporter)